MKHLGQYVQMKFASLSKRLKADFQLSIITLFGVSSLLLILPFAIYRLLSGNWLVASLDFLLVFGIACPVVYAWTTGNKIVAGRIMVLIYSTGAIASAVLLGVVGLFWMYATILANFFWSVGAPQLFSPRHPW